LGPTGKYFRKFGLTVSGAAKKIGMHEDSLRRFYQGEQLDRYCGKAKQAALRRLLHKTPQQFAKELKMVRAQHAAAKKGTE
jgi:hypothetical protein